MWVRFIQFVKLCWERAGRFPEVSLHRDFVSSERGSCWNLHWCLWNWVWWEKQTSPDAQLKYHMLVFFIETGASKKSLSDRTLLSPLRATLTSLGRWLVISGTIIAPSWKWVLLENRVLRGRGGNRFVMAKDQLSLHLELYSRRNVG